MPGTRYRKGELYAADMAHYARVLSEENTNTREMDRMKLALWRALHEDISEKQLSYMLLYYSEGLKMSEIGERLGVDKSTVSRTIKRGEYQLRRCLRYGAKRFLAEDEKPPEGETPPETEKPPEGSPPGTGEALRTGPS